MCGVYNALIEEVAGKDAHEDTLRDMHQTTLINTVDMFGFSYLANGTARLVLEDKDAKILKLAITPRGLQENKRQFAAWQKIKNTEVAEYVQESIELCKCGKVLKCKKVEGLSLEDLRKKGQVSYSNKAMDLWDLINNIKSKINAIFEDLISSDCEEKNVLFTEDNKAIIIDLF